MYGLESRLEPDFCLPCWGREQAAMGVGQRRGPPPRTGEGTFSGWGGAGKEGWMFALGWREAEIWEGGCVHWMTRCRIERRNSLGKRQPSKEARVLARHHVEFEVPWHLGRPGVEKTVRRGPNWVWLGERAGVAGAWLNQRAEWLKGSFTGVPQPSQPSCEERRAAPPPERARSVLAPVGRCASVHWRAWLFGASRRTRREGGWSQSIPGLRLARLGDWGRESWLNSWVPCAPQKSAGLCVPGGRVEVQILTP